MGYLFKGLYVAKFLLDYRCSQFCRSFIARLLIILMHLTLILNSKKIIK